MIAADLLELLRCPRTGQPLLFADEAVLARVNARVGAQPISEALVCADRSFLYPVLDDIPVLLVDEALPL